MNTESTLSIEQEFKLKWFSQETEKLSHEQTQEFLLDLFRQMLIKDNLFQKMIKAAANS